jgi:hypothetical protein
MVGMQRFHGQVEPQLKREGPVRRLSRTSQRVPQYGTLISQAGLEGAVFILEKWRSFVNLWVVTVEASS